MLPKGWFVALNSARCEEDTQSGGRDRITYEAIRHFCVPPPETKLFGIHRTVCLPPHILLDLKSSDYIWS